MESENGVRTMLVLEMARCGAVRFDENRSFRLRNVGDTCFYMQGRGALTDNPHLLALCGAYISQKVQQLIGADTRIPTLIGVPTAGTTLAVAASVASAYRHGENSDIPVVASRHMRVVPRELHGPGQRFVDGEMDGAPDLRKIAPFSVDIAVVTGTTFLQYAKRLSEDGYPVKDMPHIMLVDRQLGGAERLREKEGFRRLVVCMSMSYIVDTLVQHQVWPESAIARHELELRVR